MSDTIKAIETVYNGYRFRSRLEAKWAVFFDTVGIKYQYEPEGYKLSDGSLYLPDFYLPDCDYYVEVKGYNEHLVDDIRKIETFVEDKKTAIIMLSNIPYSKASKGLYWFPIMYYTARNQIKVCNNYATFIGYGNIYDEMTADIADDFYLGMNKHWSVLSRDNSELCFKKIQAIDGSIYDDEEAPIKDAFNLFPIQEAILKARQARFEHGEKPTI